MWVEDALIKDPAFALPGRKALLKSDMEYEVLLIEASEAPIERPKKKSNKSKSKEEIWSAIPSYRRNSQFRVG